MSLLRIWYCGLAISIPDASDQVGRCGRFQKTALKHPWTIRQRMVRLDVPSLDSDSEGSRTDTEHASGFFQIHPSFSGTSIPIVTRDLVVGAKRDHSFSSPAIPTPGEEAIPIQDIRQQIIRTDPRQRAHGVDDVLRCLRTILAPPSVAAIAARYAPRLSSE